MIQVSLKTAWMDGENGKAIASYENNRLTHCPCMAIDHSNLSIYMSFTEPSGVYRIDTFDLEGRKYRSARLESRKYLPSHILRVRR